MFRKGVKKIIFYDRNRIKVVLVIPQLSTGGAEKLVFNIACNIDREKYEISVISLYPSRENMKEKKLEELGIRMIYLDKKTGFSLECMKKMRKVVKEINPDVIHSHIDVLLYLLPCYKRRQIKLHTVHSMAYFEAKGIHKFIRRIAFGLFGVKPVAIGKTVLKSICDYYGLDEKKVPCIYNGVSVPEKTENEEKTEKITFITVGTLYHIKNHKLLISAFKECVEKSQKSLKLKIVGEGDLRNELEERVKELGLTDMVEFLGWRDDVYDELYKANIYVCSSTVEGISLSIIEAMMCGLPVIASNVGGNPDLVVDGVNGKLFESENVSDLSECMLKLTEDDFLRKKFGENALEISKKFDIKKCVKEYERLYGSK